MKKRTKKQVAAELAKVKQLVADGKIEIGNAAADPARGVFEQPDVVKVTAFSNTRATGLCMQWARKGVGFGEYTFAVHVDDMKLHVDMEGMSDKFVLGVVEQALKEAKRR